MGRTKGTDNVTTPNGPTPEEEDLAWIEHRLRGTGAVTDDSGVWTPPAGDSATAPARSPRKTLAEWEAEYPYETAPHPYIHKVKAIPMGGDRVPMNHSADTLNLIAIHLARLGAIFPDDDGNYTATTGTVEIKYVKPPVGPDVVYNPGEWVDIDAEIVEEPPMPEIDLSGVPDEQLAALEAAVASARAKQAMAAGADPAARDAALAELMAVPTMNVNVAPADPAQE